MRTGSPCLSRKYVSPRKKGHPLLNSIRSVAFALRSPSLRINWPLTFIVLVSRQYVNITENDKPDSENIFCDSTLPEADEGREGREETAALPREEYGGVSEDTVDEEERR